MAVKLLPVLDHGNEFEKFDQDRNRHDGEATPSISKNKRIRVYHGDTGVTEKNQSCVWFNHRVYRGHRENLGLGFY